MRLRASRGRFRSIVVNFKPYVLGAVTAYGRRIRPLSAALPYGYPYLSYGSKPTTGIGRVQIVLVAVHSCFHSPHIHRCEVSTTSSHGGAPDPRFAHAGGMDNGGRSRLSP